MRSMSCRQNKTRQRFLRQYCRPYLPVYPIRVTRTDRHDNTANACCNEIDSLIGALFRQSVEFCSDALHKVSRSSSISCDTLIRVNKGVTSLWLLPQ